MRLLPRAFKVGNTFSQFLLEQFPWQCPKRYPHSSSTCHVDAPRVTHWVQHPETVLVRGIGTSKWCQEMAQEVLRSREASSTFTVRDLALISGFAGILIADGYVSSLARAVTRTTDTFFLIAALFTVLALMTRK